MKNTIEKYREKFLNEYGLKFQKEYFSGIIFYFDSFT